jgi:hypothetical protein
MRPCAFSPSQKRVVGSLPDGGWQGFVFLNCSQEVMTGELLVHPPCQHKGHEKCLLKWLTECHGTCPICFAPADLCHFAEYNVKKARRLARAGLIICISSAVS